MHILTGTTLYNSTLFSILLYVMYTMLERATLSLGTIRVTSKVALWAGSSQQGRARLASAACGVEQMERVST